MAYPETASEPEFSNHAYQALNTEFERRLAQDMSRALDARVLSTLQGMAPIDFGALAGHGRIDRVPTLVQRAVFDYRVTRQRAFPTYTGKPDIPVELAAGRGDFYTVGWYLQVPRSFIDRSNA